MNISVTVGEVTLTLGIDDQKVASLTPDIMRDRVREAQEAMWISAFSSTVQLLAEKINWTLFGPAAGMLSMMFFQGLQGHITAFTEFQEDINKAIADGVSETEIAAEFIRKAAHQLMNENPEFLADTLQKMEDDQLDDSAVGDAIWDLNTDLLDLPNDASLDEES